MMTCLHGPLTNVTSYLPRLCLYVHGLLPKNSNNSGEEAVLFSNAVYLHECTLTLNLTHRKRFERSVKVAALSLYQGGGFN